MTKTKTKKYLILPMRNRKLFFISLFFLVAISSVVPPAFLFGLILNKTAYALFFAIARVF